MIYGGNKSNVKFTAAPHLHTAPEGGRSGRADQQKRELFFHGVPLLSGNVRFRGMI